MKNINKQKYFIILSAFLCRPFLVIINLGQGKCWNKNEFL